MELYEIPIGDICGNPRELVDRLNSAEEKVPKRRRRTWGLRFLGGYQWSAINTYAATMQTSNYVNRFYEPSGDRTNESPDAT